MLPNISQNGIVDSQPSLPTRPLKKDGTPSYTMVGSNSYERKVFYFPASNLPAHPLDCHVHKGGSYLKIRIAFYV